MPIPIEQLRWTFCGLDVTCENCHTAMYRPAPNDALCPTCLAAAGEDLFVIHAHMADGAASRSKDNQAA